MDYGTVHRRNGPCSEKAIRTRKNKFTPFLTVAKSDECESFEHAEQPLDKTLSARKMCEFGGKKRVRRRGEQAAGAWELRVRYCVQESLCVYVCARVYVNVHVHVCLGYLSLYTWIGLKCGECVVHRVVQSSTSPPAGMLHVCGCAQVDTRTYA